MGGLTSRMQNAGVEEVDIGANGAYRYPPKSGSYFASHFIMGGERFENSQPEAYLFGENMDLNFLGGKPTPFPYPAPQQNEPTKTIRSLINVRKESLRFVKALDEMQRANKDPQVNGSLYNIEFTFDSDVRCGITIYYFCTEEITSNGAVYTPRDATMNSETYHYKKGSNQQFTQVSHTFDPSKYLEEELLYKFEDEVIPICIQCVVTEGDEPRQSHMLFAVVEKNSENIYSLKPLKQKLFVDGLCYLIQEIYGIENKNINQVKDMNDDDVEDNGSECVICMSDSRDTLILPCRHLCLCNNCADSLRFQANNCPICRAPFRALLQIRAVRKSTGAVSQAGAGGDAQASQVIPPGYEAVSLIEALNGPVQPPTARAPVLPPLTSSPDVGSKQRRLDRLKSTSASCIRGHSTGSDSDSTTDRPVKETSSTPEVVMTAAPHRSHRKSDSLNLNRGDGNRKHRKGTRTSSAPEKVRLLSDSLQIVNEGNGNKKLEETPAETRSLLEGGNTVGDTARSSRPPSSRISMSTPHSLHLCERTSHIDLSPGGDDSDYFTPEDPSTTILVDQGTDTSLDTLQASELSRSESGRSSSGSHRNDSRLVDAGSIEMEGLKSPSENADESIAEEAEDTFSDNSPQRYLSPSQRQLIAEGLSPSLPGTPASNASNRSSGDSFSSTSSTRMLLPNQNCEALQEQKV